ncbi:aminoglycoside phosphotransferase family protein [Kribbella sindirgiensis]|uniref:Aminoglycoside phosphotransferase family protein n=1 Tax=Kribbella sindirgiensis TaxID=1124744 RepID=A0A4V2M2M2_9ACTN|nr:aminoglycoside phosphotransferase family protein [Kribbella sindirgiensis]TCC28722.1 aminoglycoside phosphotransferase family protein [Kribbella sindirgiensis]
MELKTVEALVSVGDRYVGRAPAFDVEPAWWAEVEAITRHLDELLGVRTVVLRLVDADEAVIGRGGRVVYHVQALDEPRNGVLDETPLPDWAAIIAPDPLRSTWAEIDGPGRLIEWAQTVVGPHDAVQVKTWNLSCLIRFPGAWAKATSRFGSIDADIIQHVHRYDATLAPAVLGQSTDDRWSLLAHAPGTDCWEPDQATVDNVVSRWVAAQAALASEAGTLAAPRLLPEELVAEVTRLLPRVTLSPGESADVEQLIQKLPGIVEELDAAGLPITVVHGDFHPGNWRSDGTNRVIVDWADAFIGHPALDVQRLHDFLPAEKHPHVTDVWCAAWKNHAPSSDPLRAIRPMKVLGYLTYALTYQRFLDNIEPTERIYHQDDPAICLRAAAGAFRDW